MTPEQKLARTEQALRDLQEVCEFVVHDSRSLMSPAIAVDLDFRMSCATAVMRANHEDEKAGALPDIDDPLLDKQFIPEGFNDHRERVRPGAECCTGNGIPGNMCPSAFDIAMQKKYTVGEPLMRKGGQNQKPVGPPPPEPKGQGGKA